MPTQLRLAAHSGMWTVSTIAYSNGICSLTFPPKNTVCEHLLKPNSLGEILHIVHVQGSHQDLGSGTTLCARALPIRHTGVEDTQGDPVLRLLSQPVLKVAATCFSRWLSLRKNSPFPWEACCHS